MKILIVDTYPVRRGAQIFVAELSDRWREQGHLIKKIYLYHNSLAKANLELHVGDEVLPFHSNSILEKVPTFQPRLSRKLKSSVLAFEPDIILLNGSRTLKYGAILKLSLGNKIPMISRVIDDPTYWNAGPLQLLYYKKIIIPALDAAIGVSNSSIQAMRNHYNFNKHTTVIHRSLNERKFVNVLTRSEARSHLGIDEGAEVLLFVGSISRQKRPDRFLEIFSRIAVKRPKLKGLMLGDGPDLPQIQQQISCLPQLNHYGSVDDVSPFFAAADILVLTSDTEGLPGVVLEAAWFAVPSVASSVGGIRECIQDQLTGRIIGQNDLDGFDKAIEALLDNPTERILMGLRAKELVEKHFSLTMAAGKYIEFFKKILSN